MTRNHLVIPVTAAALLAGAAVGFGATSAETAYDRPEALGTPANVTTLPTGEGLSGGGQLQQVADTSTGTLPVTGFDALIILGAAAVAGAAGVGLRRASRK